MSLIFYNGQGTVACFDRGPLLTGGQGKYPKPVRHVGDVAIFHFNGNASVHIATRFIEKLSKKKGYKKKPFPLDKLAKKLARHRGMLKAADTHANVERVMIHWPHKCPTIITIEKGVVSQQGLGNCCALGFYESQAHGAFWYTNDIQKTMESLRGENMGDANAKIIYTRLKGFPQ